jgi:radical SAM superfamily enzyme YgiQ (UPF0313 family)
MGERPRDLPNAIAGVRMSGGLVTNSGATKRRFQLILLKPSHYDDDGYVIRWWRSLIPSNSLAALYGLALDCAQRQVLSPDVTIDIEVLDETNTRVNIPKLIHRFHKHENFGLLGLVGVQSNQYPRALDIARPFRDAGIPVVMGGFHVSGCLAMLDGSAVDLDRARNMGISLFAGEAEGRFDAVLRDAAAGALKPLYNYVDDLPVLGGAPVPFLPREFVKRTAGTNTSFDAGRGCPFQCSFCTIINVQGRKSRFRTADDIEKIVRDNYAQNITRFFVTDDNFARNKEWEAIFDRLAKLREVDRIPLGIMIQVDTMCHKIDGFIQKAKRAGVTRVFIGLENINPDSLAAAKKKQNKITEYRKMLLAWKAQGIFVYAGYILGFPGETPESIRRDIEIIQRELPLDLLEFNILTPLPGSEDHKALWSKAVDMDADLNKYDLEHVVMDHPKMTRDALEAMYQEAWRLYYTSEHIETLFRRAAVTSVPMGSLAKVLIQFCTMMQLERIHPLQSGILRMKHPTERRPELGQENLWRFYVRYIRNLLSRNARFVMTAWHVVSVMRRVQKDPNKARYTDQALTPVQEDEAETFDYLTKTDGAKAAIDHIKKVEALTHKGQPAFG